jgi:O-antigen/teichoic acid export membrane protein
LWAASPALLLFFVRPVTDGALQGIQAFAGFGLVQVTQSFLRITFAAVLIWLGFGASGAIFALPLACAAALGLALFFLRSYFRDGDDIVDRSVSWHYSAHTLLGLSAFAVLSNVDAVFVKRFFSPEVAGNYGPVVTLAKVSSFLPLAIGILLFPKVTQRQVVGRDPRPILLAAITATLAPGLVLTALYFTFPGQLVRIIFANAYADPGIVLGLATLAATFYAGLNIWLNYALSLGRPAFVYVLGGVLIGQTLGMYVFGREGLVAMTLVMVAAGLIGNVAGFATTWFTTVKPAVSLQATG